MLTPAAAGASEINMTAVLIANALAVSLMAMILLGRRKHVRLVTMDGKLYYWMCRICLLFCLLETGSFALSGKDFPFVRPVLIGINTAVFLLIGVITYLWICYVDYKLFEDVERLRRIYPYLAIPSIVICVLTLVNIFTGLFFYIDGDNVYRRLPLLALPFLVAYGYMTYGAVLAYYYRSKLDKYLFLPALVFLLPVYLGGVIQILNHGISLVWACTAIGLTFLYINLQSEETLLDPLTGLYNRNYLVQYIHHLGRKVRKGLRVTGIMIDVNNFKHINDNYGHITGDAVLQAVGKILLCATDRDTVVARYGGDEFVILLEEKQPDEVETIKTRIQRELDLYNASLGVRFPLSLSFGTAEFKQLDINSFFQEMDRNMYREKRSFYLAETRRQTWADRS